VAIIAAMKSNRGCAPRHEGYLQDFLALMVALRPVWFLAIVLLLAASLGVVLVAW
jgi:hypothetical protein